MTPKQREVFCYFQEQLAQTGDALHRLLRKSRQLEALFDSVARAEANEDFTPDEVEHLVRLNNRLAFLQCYLHQVDQSIYEQMSARVADPTDPLDDFEVDVTLSFMMREDDPELADDSDNFLTTRTVCILGDHDDRMLGEDFRETIRRFPGRLNEIPHCWLFHDLYDHSYGLKAPAVSLHDCLRIGRIWVEIAVRHQSTLDLETGHWLPADR